MRTHVIAQAEAPRGEIEFGRIPTACEQFGLSRSHLYLLAGQGLVRFIKSGKATLVDFASVRNYLANCPPAEIRAPRAA